MIKLLLLMCLSPALLAWALYGDLSASSSAIVAAIAGALPGFYVGIVVAIEKLYEHTTGEALESQKFHEILSRLF